MANASRAVGFRFHPTEEELVNYYLKLKVLGRDHQVSEIAEVNIYDHEPWHLPRLSKVQSVDPVWFFFCPRNYKYANSKVAKRTTKAGYWKVTSKDRKVEDESGLEIAVKKTLVFYNGRYPNGVKTNYVMHEYNPSFNFPNQKDYVLCKLKEKSDDAPIEENEQIPPMAASSSSSNAYNHQHQNVNAYYSSVEGQFGSQFAQNAGNINMQEDDSQLQEYLRSFSGSNQIDNDLNYAMYNGQSSSSYWF